MRREQALLQQPGARQQQVDLLPQAALQPRQRVQCLQQHCEVSARSEQRGQSLPCASRGLGQGKCVDAGPTSQLSVDTASSGLTETREAARTADGSPG